jgi:hypothetical protein
VRVVLNSLSKMMPSTRITRCFGVLAQSGSPDALFCRSRSIFSILCKRCATYIWCENRTSNLRHGIEPPQIVRAPSAGG